jgi:predicted RNA-binding protein with PIN domain
MPILIDGHNVIGQIPEITLAAHDDEWQLVQLLRGYAARRRIKRIVVIFDGGVYGHPQNLNGYGVECHFAKSPVDADRELIRRIRAIRRRGEWHVVSSDRAVIGEARAHGISVFSSQKFAQKLFSRRTAHESPQQPRQEEPHKHHIPSRQEVDDWLRFFGIDEDEDEERPY